MALTSIAFLLAFSAGLLAAFIRHPVYGLYTYVAVFYLHPADRWWGYYMPDLRWALLAAAVTLLATLRHQAPAGRPAWAMTTPGWLLILFTGWLWIQMGWALDRDYQQDLAILYTKYLILLYLMHRLLTDPEKITGFLLAHVLGCIYLGLLVMAAPPGGRLEGVGGPGIDEANALGMQLTTGLFCAAALLVRAPWSFRIVALASVPLMANGLVQTDSRSAFLGLVLGGAAFVLLSPPSYRKLWYACGAGGLLVLLSMAPAKFWERMTTIQAAVDEQAELDRSADTRLALMEAQWEMFRRHPLGTGHRGTAVLSPIYLDESQLTTSQDAGGNVLRARSSHNTTMTILTEHGVPGALVFTGLLAWALRNAYRLRKLGKTEEYRRLALISMGIGGALGSVFVAGQFVDYLKAEALIWMIGLLAAVSLLNPTPRPVPRPLVQRSSTHGMADAGLVTDATLAGRAR